MVQIVAFDRSCMSPLTTIMLPRLRPKYGHIVPLLHRSLSARLTPAGPRLLRPFECRLRSGTQARFYAQQPPKGGGFPAFSFQQQRNKGDALKEFVGPSSAHPTTAGDADQL